MLLFNTITNRWHAFAIHIAISLIIFFTLLAIIIFLWFPGVLIEMGGYQGIKIIAGVDIVLGPLLTLIVFNHKKKSLKFDLTVIASIQIAALIAGIYLTYQQRPLIQLFADDGLYIYTQSDFTQFNINLTELDHLESSYPIKAYLDQPNNPDQITQIKKISAFLGTPLTLNPNLYKNLNASKKTILTGRLEKYQYSPKYKCHWMPVSSTHYFGSACLNLNKGAVLLK